MNEPHIAVLMTCHNRRDLTLRCLGSLKGQPLFHEQNLFLVDDGSNDGTAAAVRGIMPGAHVIPGDGSLFWNGGMRLAWESALASGQAFDFYLWLNDDVELAPGALAEMVAAADTTAASGAPVIVVAALSDPVTGELTYGGHHRPDRARPLRMHLAEPTGQPQPVDTLSGNLVLVSAAAERQLGNLLGDFEHIYGDLDYGLRARAAGIPVALAGRALGTCGANPLPPSMETRRGRFARLRAKWAEDRKVHMRDWRRFVRLHGGGKVRSLAHRVAPYVRILLSR